MKKNLLAAGIIGVIVLGVAAENPALWIALGMALGVAIDQQVNKAQ